MDAERSLSLINHCWQQSGGAEGGPANPAQPSPHLSPHSSAPAVGSEAAMCQRCRKTALLGEKGPVKIGAFHKAVGASRGPLGASLHSFLWG